VNHIGLLAILLVPWPTWASEQDFESAVAPLLVSHCLECHQEKAPSGGLVLATRAGLLAGGESGAVIDLEDVDTSLILQRVRDGEMPPAKQGHSQALAQEQIKLLEKWLAEGAPWPDNRTLELYEQSSEVRGGRDWWSFQPLKRPPVPTISRYADAYSPAQVIAAAESSPIDLFIREKLAEQGMAAAPRADKRQLLRRIYNDVIGLPPSRAEVEAFVADQSPGAWERVVDRLLESPLFGERWGRYWLDVVRYAETSGYERDQEKAFAWKYRDWVVRAINEDMPYDQFIIEQLAGDEFESRSESSVIATGMLRLGTWNDEPNDPADYVYDRLEDLVHVTATAFLGLSVRCARCHDHKFDPIYQEDYYRMAGAFWPGPVQPRSSELLGGPTVDELGIADVLAWTDITKDPGPLHLLRNGEREHPMQAVSPGTLSTFPASFQEFVDWGNEGKSSLSRTTGRRLKLSKWIASRENPLTPRVIVNRLWLHHFGQGLVRSVDNFGFTGEKPTHPELLDWLATELVAGGWHLKRIHKMILMSETYCQSSLHPEAVAYEKLDAGNRLWWRGERRRLDAEALRDALLRVAGMLDEQIGGASFRATVSPEALDGLSQKSAAWNASSEAEQNRRSLYMHSKRGLLTPMMTTFDLCDGTQPVGQRDVTTVAPQSLVMLNNEFIHRCGMSLAKSVCVGGASPEERVGLIWEAVFAREPSRVEMEFALHYLHEQEATFVAQAENIDKEQVELQLWSSLAVALMNTNEFIYVD
jgi:hypothetical protein